MDTSVDQLIEDIGFGPWQILCAAAVCLFQISSAVQYINTIFVNKPNITPCYTVFHQNFSQEERVYYQYKVNNSESINNGVHCLSTSPYIASFTFESTFSSEFGLTDEKTWISSLYQMSFVLGVIFGNTMSGISDFIGRLTILRWGLVGYILGTLSVSLSPNMYVILVSRFIVGFTHEFYQTPAFILLLEITPVKQRSFLGFMVMLPYNLGGILIGGLAYLIRPWRLFHLITSVPVFLLAICIFFITKSPRWLITQNRLEEAADVIEKASNMNKGKIPSREKVMSILEGVAENSKANSNSKDITKISKIQQVSDFLKLFFATSKMLRVSLITPFIWLAVGLVYYGITLNASNFTSNIYIYISLIHLSETFPIVGTSLLINKLGNILTNTILCATAGLCILGVILLPDIWWIKWLLVVMAFMASGSAFAVCLIMTNELYPTVVRSTGLGFCSLTSNVGTLLASYLYEIVVQRVWWLPNSICVVFCLIATIILQFLPETNGKPLCETVEQVEERGVKPTQNLDSENTQANA